VQVRLRNDGAPAEVLNPAALRASPSWRLAPWPDEDVAPGSGRVFGNEQGYAPPPGEPERLTLDTGKGWDGTVTINADNAQVTPGEWALSLLLTVDGVVQESPSCKVRVAGWSIVAADAGFGVPALGRQNGDTLLLQGEGGARILYRMPWQEEDSDRTGHGGEEPIPLITVDPEAADPLVPVRDGAFFGDPARWLLWREGATVRAFGTAGEPQTLVLPEPPATLLRPALQRTGGDILLLALSADRRRLDRLIFSRDASTLPLVADGLALPVAVSAGTAAFAKDGDVLVGLSGATSEGTALLLIDRGGAGTPRVVVLAAATPIPDAAPALLVNPDGSVVIGALVSTEAGIAVAEARFPADPFAMAVVARPLGQQSGAPPISGAMLYSAARVGAEADGAGGDSSNGPSVHIVVRLADGTLLRLDPDGTLNPTTYEAPPVVPLILVPASHGALLLCCDPLVGPFMAEA
jgi:hypothetical protein